MGGSTSSTANDIVNSFLDLVNSVVNTATDVYNSVIDTFGDILSYVNYFSYQAQQRFNSFSDILGGILSFLTKLGFIFQDILKTLLFFVELFNEYLVDPIKSVFDEIKRGIDQLVVSILTVYNVNINQGAITNILDSIGFQLQQNFPNTFNFLSGNLNAISATNQNTSTYTTQEIIKILMDTTSQFTSYNLQTTLSFYVNSTLFNDYFYGTGPYETSDYILGKLNQKSVIVDTSKKPLLDRFIQVYNSTTPVTIPSQYTLAFVTNAINSSVNVYGMIIDWLNAHYSNYTQSQKDAKFFEMTGLTPFTSTSQYQLSRYYQYIIYPNPQFGQSIYDRIALNKKFINLILGNILYNKSATPFYKIGFLSDFLALSQYISDPNLVQDPSAGDIFIDLDQIDSNSDPTLQLIKSNYLNDNPNGNSEVTFMTNKMLTASDYIKASFISVQDISDIDLSNSLNSVVILKYNNDTNWSNHSLYEYGNYTDFVFKSPSNIIDLIDYQRYNFDPVLYKAARLLRDEVPKNVFFINHPKVYLKLIQYFNLTFDIETGRYKGNQDRYEMWYDIDQLAYEKITDQYNNDWFWGGIMISHAKKIIKADFTLTPIDYILSKTNLTIFEKFYLWYHCDTLSSWCLPQYIGIYEQDILNFVTLNDDTDKLFFVSYQSIYLRSFLYWIYKTTSVETQQKINILNYNSIIFTSSTSTTLQEYNDILDYFVNGNTFDDTTLFTGLVYIIRGNSFKYLENSAHFMLELTKRQVQSEIDLWCPLSVSGQAPDPNADFTKPAGYFANYFGADDYITMSLSDTNLKITNSGAQYQFIQSTNTIDYTIYNNLSNGQQKIDYLWDKIITKLINEGILDFSIIFNDLLPSIGSNLINVIETAAIKLKEGLEKGDEIVSNVVAFGTVLFSIEAVLPPLSKIWISINEGGWDFGTYWKGKKYKYIWKPKAHRKVRIISRIEMPYDIKTGF